MVGMLLTSIFLACHLTPLFTSPLACAAAYEPKEMFLANVPLELAATPATNRVGISASAAFASSDYYLGSSASTEGREWVWKRKA
ncbi:hypothetical protein DFH29DRAFT_919645 [Suillus ampliporus]|nr:hypothetical protein DFH29DRAFT_919645 [Suillus ampliporus]